ncbi:MAG: anthranilate synthase component II [Chitinophagaceae bacterium]
MRILLLDNYDSFTHNIIERLRGLNFHDISKRYNDNFDITEISHFDALILSPGPGTPREAGCLIPLIAAAYTQIPILGICLGHQAIAEYFGAQLINLHKPFHGIQSTLNVLDANNPLLAQLHQKSIGRYHSWVVDDQHFPEILTITATSEEGHIMALEHRHYPVYGVQFHPESYMCPEGDTLFTAFLEQAHARTSR